MTCGKIHIESTRKGMKGYKMNVFCSNTDCVHTITDSFKSYNSNEFKYCSIECMSIGDIEHRLHELKIFILKQYGLELSPDAINKVDRLLNSWYKS